MPTHTFQAATATEDPIQYQCRHIRPDGHRCGSPSLRAQNFCFYHERARKPGPRQPQVTTATARKNSTFDLPSPADLADRAGLQLALALLLGKIAHNEIDSRRAGLLLYGLQTAAMLLPKEQRKAATKGGRTFSGGPRSSAPDTHREAGPVEDIVDDPVHGPLAPEAEVGENDSESTLERWARELREEREADRLAEAAADAAAAAEAKAATAANAAQTAPAEPQPAAAAQPPAGHPHGTDIPPSFHRLTAAAAPVPQPHKPNRACRRQAAKQKRRQQTR